MGVSDCCVVFPSETENNQILQLVGTSVTKHLLKLNVMTLLVGIFLIRDGEMSRDVWLLEENYVGL